MSDSFRIDVPRLPGFTAALKAAPRTLGRELLTAGRRIAKRGESLSSQFAARDTGFMASTIWSESSQAGASVTAMWGATADYAAAHDKGRRAVTIVPKSRKFLKFEIGGETIFARKVFQPARAGKPFVTKAFQMAKQGFARQEFLDAIKRTLDSIRGAA